jgi:hypothetical protein
MNLPGKRKTDPGVFKFLGNICSTNMEDLIDLPCHKWPPLDEHMWVSKQGLDSNVRYQFRARQSTCFTEQAGKEFVATDNDIEMVGPEGIVILDSWSPPLEVLTTTAITALKKPYRGCISGNEASILWDPPASVNTARRTQKYEVRMYDNYCTNCTRGWRIIYNETTRDSDGRLLTSFKAKGLESSQRENPNGFDGSTAEIKKAYKFQVRSVTESCSGDAGWLKTYERNGAFIRCGDMNESCWMCEGDVKTVINSWSEALEIETTFGKYEQECIGRSDMIESGPYENEDFAWTLDPRNEKGDEISRIVLTFTLFDIQCDYDKVQVVYADNAGSAGDGEGVNDEAQEEMGEPVEAGIAEGGDADAEPAPAPPPAPAVVPNREADNNVIFEGGCYRVAEGSSVMQIIATKSPLIVKIISDESGGGDGVVFNYDTEFVGEAAFQDAEDSFDMPCPTFKNNI